MGIQMNEILFALMMVSKAPAMPDQQVAVFTSRAQCMAEAQNIIQQGPSAYCVPVNQQPSPEEAIRRMTSLMQTMMKEMDNVR
jgi:hypothetical protein